MEHHCFSFLFPLLPETSRRCPSFPVSVAVIHQPLSQRRSTAPLHSSQPEPQQMPQTICYINCPSERNNHKIQSHDVSTMKTHTVSSRERRLRGSTSVASACFRLSFTPPILSLHRLLVGRYNICLKGNNTYSKLSGFV